MATNVTFHEVREAILFALMNIVITSPAKIPGMFNKWGELLQHFTEDEDAQVDIVFIVQRFFAKRGKGGFVKGLQSLYDVDCLEEEAIFRWFGDERAKGVGEKWGEEMATLRKSAEKFVTWLEEADEEE